jgi:HD superfamily phosphohydrolase
MQATNGSARVMGQVIRDPIHGAIRLHDHEVEVINHPLFQRLRHICQNDILNLVFPGATHTRFIHSIGAMDVAERMLQEVVRSHLYEARREHLSTEQAIAIGYLGRCLRLAMLLHDTGHGSFSHQMEFTPEVQTLLAEEGLFERLWEGARWQDFYRTPPEKLHHEHYSVRVAHKILEDAGIDQAGVDTCDVLMLMETTSVTPSARFVAAAELAWPIFAGGSEDAPSQGSEKANRVAELLGAIVSGELDADKADYILRDSQYCSVSYGQITLDTLVNTVRSGWIPEENWLGLAVVQKGAALLEDFVHSRFQLYKSVYNHKTAVGFDLLLQRAIGEYMRTDSGEAQMREFLSSPDAFVDLTDTFFWEQFRASRRRDSTSAGARMVNRDKLDHLGTYENLPGFRVHEMRRELAGRLRVSEETILHRTNFARFSKISGGYTAIKVVVKDSVDGRRAYRSLTEVSDFFGKFSDLTLTHFYRQ